MIAHRASWRYALLAAAILVGVIVAFARGSASSAPALALPETPERIFDGHRDTLPRFVPEPRGVLDDSLVDRPDRGF